MLMKKMFWVMWLLLSKLLPKKKRRMQLRLKLSRNKLKNRRQKRLLTPLQDSKRRLVRQRINHPDSQSKVTLSFQIVVL